MLDHCLLGGVIGSGLLGPPRRKPKKAGISLSNAYAYVNCGLLGDRGRHDASDAIEEFESYSYSSCTSHRSPTQLSFQLLRPRALHRPTTLLRIIGAAIFVLGTASKGKAKTSKEHAETLKTRSRQGIR